MSSQTVIRNYLLIAGLYTLSASLIWGVNTLFLLAAGLDIFGVFIANAIFTAAMAVFEIPTGVMADTVGRRASFLLSVAVLALGTFGYVAVSWWGGGLLAFGFMSVILGLGYTFYSGAVEAWLVDALDASGYEGSLDTIFSRAGMVTGAAMLLGTVGGGFLGDIDLSAPFLVRIGLLLLLLVFAYFTMFDQGYTARAIRYSEIPAEMGKVAQASLKYGWKQPGLRNLMLMGLVQGSFLAWAWYAWQPYFLELLGTEAVWVAGVVAALVSLSMMLGNALVSWLMQFCGRRTTLLLWAAGVFAVAMFVVGITDNFWVAVPVFLFALGAYGVMQPVRQAYIHSAIPSEARATIVSLDSMVASAGGVVGQSGLGYLAQMRSLGAGYVSGGFISLLLIPILLRLRSLDEEQDFIIGTGGEDRTAVCAAEGLPNVSGIETRPQLDILNET